MARIAASELERLKREIDLVRLVEGSGVALKAHGADRIGHCPFHDDISGNFRSISGVFSMPSLGVRLPDNLFNAWRERCRSERVTASGALRSIIESELIEPPILRTRQADKPQVKKRVPIYFLTWCSPCLPVRHAAK